MPRTRSIAWSQLKVGMFIVAKVLQAMPGDFLGNEPFSILQTGLSTIGEAWAFWAMMQAAEKGYRRPENRPLRRRVIVRLHRDRGNAEPM